MKRSIVILLIVSLAIVKAALAAGANNDWNSAISWGGTQTVNNAGVGYRTWYVPQATGMSGTLMVSVCRTNAFNIEPNTSAATFDVYKCSQQFDRGDALDLNCGKYNSVVWDSDGGAFDYIGDYIVIDVQIADAAAEIVHQCGAL